MKRIINIISIAAVALLSSVAVYGQQNLRTAYFLDGYTYNYKMNPAMAPERGFFAMPMIGNVGVGIESNLALSTFLYPIGDGKMTTFMNNAISDEQFLDKLRDRNRMNFSINESIFATGFRTGRSFHTIDLSVKADGGSVVPKDLYAFMKTGSSNGATSWDISRTGIRTNARVEFAYGYSRPIADWIRVGARIKILMGIARADVLIDDLNLKMSGEEWAATAHGEASISAPVSFDSDGETKEIELSEYLSKPSIGAALDLGASFDFLDYFTASVSVLDLGFIGWNSTTTAIMPGGRWSFDGFGTISMENDLALEDQLSTLGDELLNMLKLEKTGDLIKKTSMLAATIHAGVEARMPFYDRLTFGFLGTQRIDGIYSWTEGRFSANLAPVNFFSIAASYAISNFGSSVGGVVNIHLPGFNLYAGLDSFLPLMNVTPQFVPIDSANTNLTFGLTFSFGKAEGRYRK